MSLQLFNTLSGRKEEFKPLHPPEVRMYTCGPTVYDFAHIGNFRTYMFQDLLKRYLSYKGFRVSHVMNITDVDDKTIAGANKQRIALSDYTRGYTDAFHEDLKTLGILSPMVELSAVGTIPKMIDMISRLVEKNHAYVKDGSVYFRVSSFPRYGMLSKKDLEKNIVGARVDQDEYEKEEGADFALWKKAKEGEPSWDSPWGKGRPGWHIECSVMSLSAFDGETLDIHTGGEDLIFPHHENEIAQSECATGKKFVHYWLHAKHLLVDGEKMSKSKGNFYTLRDVLAKGFHPKAIRYLLLGTHYRKQLNFTFEGIQASKEALKRIYDFWSDVCQSNVKETKGTGKVGSLVQKAREAFQNAMDDDLNISEALAALFDFVKEVNLIPSNQVSREERSAVDSFLREVDQVLNVFDLGEVVLPSEIKELIKAREEARSRKDFKTADRIRLEIKAKGYVVEDGGNGVKIKKVF